MAQKKYLTKEQLAVIEDFFIGQLTETEILKKHKISAKLFSRWQSNELFVVEFDRRIETLNRQSEFIIAKYAALAAAKLVQLTESQNAETARKACLDIISLPKQTAKKNLTAPDEEIKNNLPSLSPETASRILTALAKEKTTI